jgi:CP family cyanate transporter-like MFS transporter
VEPGAEGGLGPAATTTTVLIAILVTAFNLRVGIVAVGPVIEEVRADTGMSSAAVSALIVLPVACMGIFAFAGAALIRRIGASPLIGIGLILITAGTIVRAGMPTPLLLMLATLPIGIGIAVIGVALPGVVKHHFPLRGGATTGLYVASLNVGAAAAALAIVPLAAALGGWRWGFVATAVPCAVAALLWHRARTDRDPEDREARPVSSLRPPAGGLVLAAIFGLQSMVFTGAIAWIAAIYVEAGWTPAEAAVTTAAIPILTIPVALTVPRLSEGRDRRLWVLVTSLVMGLGTLGVGLAPSAAPVLWLLLLGLGSGAVFPLCMCLPLDLRATPAEVTDLTAWMLGLGYLISTTSALSIGALRDATGSFEIPFAGVLTAASVGCGLLTLALPRATGRR